MPSQNKPICITCANANVNALQFDRNAIPKQNTEALAPRSDSVKLSVR
jgi:hypothetical protein